MSAVIASTSTWMWRARATTASPSWVRLPLERSTRVAPRSRSRRAMWVEMFDCTVWSTRAAAEKLPTSDTTMRAFSWRRSIAKHDGTYRKQLFAGLLAHLYLDGQHEEASHPPGRPRPRAEAGCPPKSKEQRA